MVSCLGRVFWSYAEFAFVVSEMEVFTIFCLRSKPIVSSKDGLPSYIVVLVATSSTLQTTYEAQHDDLV